MLFKVQNKDFSSMLTDIKLQLVRTYKGEIHRTQAGVVAAFPVSFITVGFDLQFLGFRQDIQLLQQVLLSSDTVEVVTNYSGTAIKGKFSCTSNNPYEELRDKNERRVSLSVSIVSDGTNITKPDGSAFTVKVAGAPVLSTCYFGKVYTVGSYYKGDVALPDGKLLVLGDENLINP